MRIKEGFVLRTIVCKHIVTGDSAAHINFNKLICLNRSAAYLWQEIERGEFDEEILADLLFDRYEVDSESALRDSRNFIAELKKIGVIE